MIERTEMEVIRDKEWAGRAATGTSFRMYLGEEVTYRDLVDTFGEPTFTPEDSGDGKVNYEWVFFFDGDYFTIYDWKTYDPEATRLDYTNWHVGGKTGVFLTDAFIRNVLDRIRHSVTV